MLGNTALFPTDLVIRVKGGRAFNCHKSVMQSRTSYFKGLVSGPCIRSCVCSTLFFDKPGLTTLISLLLRCVDGTGGGQVNSGWKDSDSVTMDDVLPDEMDWLIKSLYRNEVGGQELSSSRLHRAHGCPLR